MIRYKWLAGFIVVLFVFGMATIDYALAGEKVKSTATSVRTKWHPIKVDDEEGHLIAVFESKNVYSKTKDGEILTGISRGLVDMNVKTGQGTMQGYVVITYPNGDKIFTKTEGQLLGKGRAEGTGVYIGGTGRFEGVQGNAVFKSKAIAPGVNFLEIEGERELPGK